MQTEPIVTVPNSEMNICQRVKTESSEKVLVFINLQNLGDSCFKFLSLLSISGYFHRRISAGLVWSMVVGVSGIAGSSTKGKT